MHASEIAQRFFIDQLCQNTAKHCQTEKNRMRSLKRSVHEKMKSSNHRFSKKKGISENNQAPWARVIFYPCLSRPHLQCLFNDQPFHDRNSATAVCKCLRMIRPDTRLEQSLWQGGAFPLFISIKVNVGGQNSFLWEIRWMAGMINFGHSHLSPGKSY